jgi:hypothetical protein
MLTTREAHRRRGLARVVLIDLLQQLICAGRQERHPLFCYVVDSNAASRGLLGSLLEEGSVFTWQGWQRPG